MVRRGICTFLEEESTHLVIAQVGDGLLLLDELERKTPDLILLDITMPNLGGIDAIPLILEKQKDAKIIILTMHKNERYLCSALVAGAKGFLLKEDSDTELLLAIDSVMQGGLAISTEFNQGFGDDILADCYERKAISQQMISPREKQILKLISKGITNKNIGEMLNISKRTVENHRASLKKKLNARKTADLVKYAIAHGYVEPSE